MTADEFLTAYNELCAASGWTLRPVDQRQSVDNVWIISNPRLEIVPFEPPNEERNKS